jgi:hypothetical protein
MGIINGHQRGELDRIRRIRNTFAHAMLTVSFQDHTIAKACRNLDHNRLVPNAFHMNTDAPRARYIVSASFALVLLHRLTERMTELHYGANLWRSEPLDKFARRLLPQPRNLS